MTNASKRIVSVRAATVQEFGSGPTRNAGARPSCRSASRRAGFGASWRSTVAACPRQTVRGGPRRGVTAPVDAACCRDVWPTRPRTEAPRTRRASRALSNSCSGPDAVRSDRAGASGVNTLVRLAALEESVPPATMVAARAILARTRRRSGTSHDFEGARGHRFAGAPGVLHRGVGARSEWETIRSTPGDSARQPPAPARTGGGASTRVALVRAVGRRVEVRVAGRRRRRATYCPTCSEASSERAMLERTGEAASRSGPMPFRRSRHGRRARVILRRRGGHPFMRGAEGVYRIGRTRRPGCRGHEPRCPAR